MFFLLFGGVFARDSTVHWLSNNNIFGLTCVRRGMGAFSVFVRFEIKKMAAYHSYRIEVSHFI